MKNLYLLLIVLTLTGSAVSAQNLIDLSLLSTYESGVFDEGAMEILAHDPVNQRIFAVNADAGGIDIFDISNPASISLMSSIDVSPYGAAANSVAYYGGFIVVAVEDDNKQANGRAVFYDVNGTYIADIEAGALPDMVTFTPDGNKVIVANEGEPNDEYTIDPQGSVTIIDVSGGIPNLTQANATQVSFSQFDGQEATLRAQGIRIFGEGPATATDLFFSEYGEGSSQNKYLEIYNGTGSDVDLSDYVVRENFNGNFPWTGEFFFPAGTILADGDVYILAHEDADSMITMHADTLVVNPFSGGSSYVCTFNGDDVRGLFKIDAATGDTNCIDLIGYYDLANDSTFDPGSGFDVAGVSAGMANHTLIRKPDVMGGGTDWYAIAGTDSLTSEYLVLPSNSWADVGMHSITSGVVPSSASQDLEPEYVAVAPNGTMAFVVCQENNAMIKIDLSNNTITTIGALGFKDWSTGNNVMDASNRSSAVEFKNWPIFGMYQPDAMVAFEDNGTTYIATANEGDARDYDGYSEEERVEDLTLDATAFPNAADIQNEDSLGRMNITTTLGDTDGDGDYDELYAYGARSFSIWDENLSLVWDSEAQIGQQVFAQYPTQFNSTNDDNDSFKNRSDDKGTEPEAIDVAEMGGMRFAFIGLERMGGVMVYNITNPTAPSFVSYFLNRNFTIDADQPGAGDLGPECVVFIPGSESPNGQPLLAVASEVSGTLSLYSVGGTIGLDEESRREALQAFPNPVVDVVHFNHEVTGGVLYDLNGRRVMEVNGTSADLSNVARGLYVLRTENKSLQILKQ